MHQHEGARHLSMNLGQAVAVCLYELVREQAARSVVKEVDDVADPATAAQLERVTVLLSEVLERASYARRHAANSEPAQVRRMVRRIGMDAVDAPIWMGILRHVLRRLGASVARDEES
jgi:tRNA/rRNA methyltransferase